MTESTSASPPTGTIVWFEMPSDDTARAQEFYGGLFGWSFEQFGDADYYAANDAGGALYNGASARGVMAYFGVDDIETSARRVGELGGYAGPKQEIPGIGFYVQCLDADGNKFGLFQGGAS